MAAIDNKELLARFIVSRSWVRAVNQTIKPDAFMPKDTRLSVTRHLKLSSTKIWEIAHKVAEKRGRSLRGRADVLAGSVRDHGLDVEPRPESGNLNHADIIDWPEEKDAKKMRAMLIAQSAIFIPTPV